MHRGLVSSGIVPGDESLPPRERGAGRFPRRHDLCYTAAVCSTRPPRSSPAFFPNYQDREGALVSHQFVCTLYKLKKVVPPDRVILDDITLAFLPGAKIGVLGANGAGKSSLLRIMAGVDTEIQGECQTLP